MPIEKSRRKRSISTRLTWLLTLVALVAMALFAIFANWRLTTNFEAEHLRFLQAKTSQLHRALDEAGGSPRAMIAEIARETAGTRLREYLARVIGTDGRVLDETPGMQHLLLAAVFPRSVNDAPTAASVRYLRTDGHSYALTTVALRAPGDTAPLQVQIALDTTSDAHLMADFRRAMALAFLILIPLIAIAGRWVAARGLAPLRRITRAARGVTPAQLSERIPLDPPWPAELGELVVVFNAMLTRLEDAFARLSRFSADLAHELRTPLSNMRGALEVCLLRPRSAQEYREALESNLEECRRLGALIDNLLFMARAEQAETALRKETFNGAEASEWAIAQRVDDARSRGIRIELAGHADMTADPVLFRQGLTNLLTNAIQHSKVAGNVQVALSSGADGASEVQVTDHGVGIAAEHLPHLFDRFYQVNPSRTRQGGSGTGLGLAIVKAIVDMHGGDVAIVSTPGVETTVTLRFPGPSDRPESASEASRFANNAEV